MPDAISSVLVMTNLCIALCTAVTTKTKNTENIEQTGETFLELRKRSRRGCLSIGLLSYVTNVTLSIFVIESEVSH